MVIFTMILRLTLLPINIEIVKLYIKCIKKTNKTSIYTIAKIKIKQIIN